MHLPWSILLMLWSIRLDTHSFWLSALCSFILLDVTAVFLRNVTLLKTESIACLEITVMYSS